MNPNDVFPLRNLPNSEAEEWGRVVEKRIRNVEYAAQTTRQSASGLNRTTAASLQDLARQIEQLQALYAATPRPAQSTNLATNFGLSSGWNAVVSASIPVPLNVTNANLLAVASAHTITQTSPPSPGDMSHRLTLSGVGSSPTMASAWFLGNDRYEADMSPSFTWNLTVTPGGILTVNLELDPISDGIWPSGTGSYAAIALLATFTG